MTRERVVYIVPAGTPVTEDVVAAANAAGTCEILQGVPRALAHLVPDGTVLPVVVTETIVEEDQP